MRLTSIVMVSFAWCASATFVAAGEGEYPAQEWTTGTAADVGMDAAKLDRARDYALGGGGSGYVTRHGKLVLPWGDVRQRYDLKSTTKSIGVTALGLAIADGKMKLTEPAVKHHPSLGVPPEGNRGTGWIDDITLFHLATQTAGFEKPGGYGKVLFEPGTRWHYSDAGPNWLAECVTLAYGRDVDELMFERVFTPIGITRDDLTWRRNQYREHQMNGVARREFGAGVHANVDAMARIGLLYLRGGQWQEKQIIPKEFVELATRTPREVAGLRSFAETEHGNAAAHYGLLWWNNNDGTLADVPRDAYWSWGLYDSLIVVIPSLDVVVARAGKSWKREAGGKHYDVLRPFLEPIVASVRTERRDGAAGISGVEWAPVETIVRKAMGSDNWPMSWGADDALYTAYGDGWGFEPRVPKKLSLGFAKITGSAAAFTGRNIRSETGETTGDDRRGRKASGMLMVDGVLYVLARNAGNSTLAWSTDGATTWTWADWKLETSFGCPTFLNFGPDYRGARDEYVYVYSQDRDDAYTVADRVVLARVPKDRIKERAAYEFFAGADGSGLPRWSREVKERAGVIAKERGCYRCGVTYNAGLGRYLLAMTLPDPQTQRRYHLSVYQAPQPWGPWATVPFTNDFGADAGESASFPTKWMSEDGRTVHLVFSGDDSFAVRRATLKK